MPPDTPPTIAAVLGVFGEGFDVVIRGRFDVVTAEGLNVVVGKRSDVVVEGGKDWVTEATMPAESVAATICRWK